MLPLLCVGQYHLYNTDTCILLFCPYQPIACCLKKGMKQCLKCPISKITYQWVKGDIVLDFMLANITFHALINLDIWHLKHQLILFLFPIQVMLSQYFSARSFLYIPSTALLGTAGLSLHHCWLWSCHLHSFCYFSKYMMMVMMMLMVGVVFR